MKFLVEKYKVISIWLSLAVLALAFYIGSDAECRAVCVPAAFLLGAMLYGLGGVREWYLNHLLGCLIDLILTLIMLAGLILSLLMAGGLM